MSEVPDLYLTQYPAPNALAIGARRPIVVVQSELVALLDAPQRRAVFAHEAAHILSDHQLYRTALAILVLLTRSARLPLPLAPVRSALMEWGRATELTADRAAALVTRDPLVVCRTLMSLAAGAMVDQLDLDLFMRQGMDYQEKGSGLERLDAADARPRRHASAARQAHARADGVGALGGVRAHRRRRVPAPRRARRRARRQQRGRQLLRRAHPRRLPRRRRVGQLRRQAARRMAAPRRWRGARRRGRGGDSDDRTTSS